MDTQHPHAHYPTMETCMKCGLMVKYWPQLPACPGEREVRTKVNTFDANEKDLK